MFDMMKGHSLLDIVNSLAEPGARVLATEATTRSRVHRVNDFAKGCFRNSGNLPAGPPLRWTWGPSLILEMRRGDRKVARPSVALDQGATLRSALRRQNFCLAWGPSLKSPGTSAGARWAWGRSVIFRFRPSA